MLRRVNLSTTAAESVDWRLLKSGATNPIGNLRVTEAAQWLLQNIRAVCGFTDEVVAAQHLEPYLKEKAQAHAVTIHGWK